MSYLDRSTDSRAGELADELVAPVDGARDSPAEASDLDERAAVLHADGPDDTTGPRTRPIKRHRLGWAKHAPDVADASVKGGKAGALTGAGIGTLIGALTTFAGQGWEVGAAIGTTAGGTLGAVVGALMAIFTLSAPKICKTGPVSDRHDYL